ncbi:MAG: class II fructose-bisphosphate aldolase [Anaerolineales bacterium]
MSIVNAKEILIKATEEKYAVGAFNITNLIQLEAIIEVHIDKKAPLIIQTSVTPSKFLGREVIVAIYRTLAESAPIPICLHLDHCRDIDYCRQCADAGYTNIMIDASKESYEENVRQTMEVVDYCHGLGGVSVEGELGLVMGVEDQIQVVEDEAALCNPEQALDFVDRTGIDLLAPAIGTVHGVYKTKSPKVDFERFGKIAQLINGRGVRAPLVIHGGSGLPSDYVARLIELGGSKFNVSTDLKRTLIDTTYGYISEHRDEYNPGKIDLIVKDAIREKVIYWIDMLGSPGKI